MGEESKPLYVIIDTLVTTRFDHTSGITGVQFLHPFDLVFGQIEQPNLSCRCQIDDRRCGNCRAEQPPVDMLVFHQRDRIIISDMMNLGHVFIGEPVNLQHLP